LECAEVLIVNPKQNGMDLGAAIGQKAMTLLISQIS